MACAAGTLTLSLLLSNIFIASNAARDFEIVDGSVVADSCIRGTYRTGKVSYYDILGPNFLEDNVLHSYLSSLL